MNQYPESVTSKGAARLKSRGAKVTGQSQPPKDSISAEAQRQAAVNEGATKPSQTAQSHPTLQCTTDRNENFEQLASDVGSKMRRGPESVTKEHANLLHSREQRIFGETSKAGITSQAHSLVGENEKSLKVAN